MSYVYCKPSWKDPDTGRRIYEDFYVVGFYKPDGEWYTESDQATKEEAAARVAWLNGSMLEQQAEPASA